MYPPQRPEGVEPPETPKVIDKHWPTIAPRQEADPMALEEPDIPTAPVDPKPTSPPAPSTEYTESDEPGAVRLFFGHPFSGPGIEPVRVRDLAWATVRYAVDDRGQWRFIHVFELAQPGDGFLIYPWREDQGTVACLRLRDTVKGGKVMEFSHVAVARSRQGHWVVTDEARQRLIGEIRERLRDQGAW